MFQENDICFEELVVYCDRDNLLSVTRMKNSAHISLIKPQVRMIFDVIGYHNFMYQNGDKAFADDPTLWDIKDF